MSVKTSPNMGTAAEASLAEASLADVPPSGAAMVSKGGGAAG